MKFLAKSMLGLAASAMALGGATPAFAQEGDMSEAEIYALMVDCAAIEFMLHEIADTESEKTEHVNRAALYFTGAQAFSSGDEEQFTDDMSGSVEKLMGWVETEDSKLEDTIARCTAIYPVLEENLGS